MSYNFCGLKPPQWPEDWLLTHVPADLWREIFKTHVAEALLAYANGEIDSLGPHALLLSQICSAWRKIAMNAPELWSRIAVYINNTGKLSPHPRLLDLALNRAGSVPLKVSLDGVMTGGENSLAIRDAVRVLLENLHRADEIDINSDVLIQLPNLLDESPLEDILLEGTPFLRNLGLRVGTMDSRVNPRIAKIWTRAANLRSVVVDESTVFEYFYFVNTLQIPFGQLTSINIGPRISARCLYDLLSRSKNLVECIIGNLDWNLGVKLKRILLPTLRHLNLQTFNLTCLSLPFLAYLETPALISLNLEDSGADYPAFYKDFAFFLANSSCSLQHFGLNVLKSNADEKINSLELLQQLTSLTIRVKCSYDEVHGLPRGEDQARHTDFKEGLVHKLEKRDASRKDQRLNEITIVDHILPDSEYCSHLFNRLRDKRVIGKLSRDITTNMLAQGLVQSIASAICTHIGSSSRSSPGPEE